MEFTIKIDREARDDIQNAIDWYNDNKIGLGQKFFKEIEEYVISIGKNPFYQKRYDQVLCLPLKKFPFMIHFTIDAENSVITIRGIFHTSLHPKNWKR
ncbi:MAG: type II toxin-antitoxin system RelE/ParE family toxin [Crocinitomicaceae bacterium]|nr:type II toxin-antitoxin system RelE/ParE family toxin [Flavobacteriales bacterium]NQZ36879.1 type II toxin-antitoxin system RelE/ParE family toxin [Crocinitomicaceae bacterium]